MTDMNSDNRLGMGAEAIIETASYLGNNSVKKIRPVKAYRHPELDSRLRQSRIKNEVRLLNDARTSGVRTPVVYDIDLHEGSITMELIEGRKVKEIIDSQSDDTEEVCIKIGKSLAMLHSANIGHGDLTTSNMIVMNDGTLCIIDFSMGTLKCGLEGMGVDIHLLERAFTSAHSEFKHLFDIIMKSYCENMPQHESVMKRVDDIKKRARYT